MALMLDPCLAMTSEDSRSLNQGIGLTVLYANLRMSLMVASSVSEGATAFTTALLLLQWLIQTTLVGLTIPSIRRSASCGVYMTFASEVERSVAKTGGVWGVGEIMTE
jgi:hypothetical protein